MAFCKYCGIEIIWVSGIDTKWIPMEGRYDHRERCAGMERRQRDAIRDKTHEKRVTRFLKKKDRQRRKAIAVRDTPRVLTGATHYWIGAVAPWDDSLGAFRGFTDVEKTELRVCRPIQEHLIGAQAPRV